MKLFKNDRMTTVTLSQNYQVVIPKKIREMLKLKPGQKIQIIAYEDRIECILLNEINDLRGILKGVNNEIERDDDRL